MKQPELGKRIFQLRKEKGLTQEELVEQCNINVRTIQRIEAGEVNPRSYTLKTILEALGEDFKIIDKNNSSKNNQNEWTNNELKILRNSRVFAILYLVITLIGLIIETYLVANHIQYEKVFFLRTLYMIPFFIILIYFLKGYKIIAEKFNNSFLISAVKVYIVTSIIMLIITFFTTSPGFLNSLDIVLSILLMLAFGAGELIMGLGILKLKENLGSLAQITGVVKIVNGCMLITVILSPISLFFMIPILTLEIVFIFNTYNKVEKQLLTTHDDKVHS
ncbi:MULTISPECIES: helix-turn-helix domain-containing protein [Tenacibaculum]|uniref:helix-turn-helix domain-containing protein n=1 Tax=Tenacibaculum TaxID=104267 RepID=UPI0021AF975A|nr:MULTISPECIES: helix-turn-helix domain-containing protein [Tenacibaculum]MCT4697923.1 helix-turn-helix domain-containing protein [Tenacibaculum haliotis]WBX71938.1 helix-turn-helix domain-containing protein [Tenacibaculum retecalamus]